MSEQILLRHKKAKFTMALLGFAGALAALGMASYAWLTLSTNPEVRGIQVTVSGEKAIQISLDNSDYSYSKRLPSMQEKYLVPVSTVNGTDWYVCKYDSAGNVLQSHLNGAQYEYMEFPTGGYDLQHTDAGSGATNAQTEDPAEEEKYCFYAYADIYLKTTEESATASDPLEVRLSIPPTDTYVQDPTEQTHYGSYVMSYYTEDVVDENQQSSKKITLLKGGSETCVRVGFAEYDANGNIGELYIYEPNADRRASLKKELVEGEGEDAHFVYNTDQYIAGVPDTKKYAFEVQKFNVTVGEGEASQTLWYSDMNGYYIPTYPVKKKIDGTDGEASEFPESRLIVQTQSEWNISSESSISTMDQMNSEWISSMGKFVSSEKLYTGDGAVLPNAAASPVNQDYMLHDLSIGSVEKRTASPVVITRLIKDQPKKIRLYFWIEGQDIDCWNDISKTNFLANLEFAASAPSGSSGQTTENN